MSVTREILESHTVPNLKKELAKVKKSLNYGKLKKSELVDLMLKNKQHFNHIKKYEAPPRAAPKPKPKPQPKKPKSEPEWKREGYDSKEEFDRAERFMVKERKKLAEEKAKEAAKTPAQKKKEKQELKKKHNEKKALDAKIKKIRDQYKVGDRLNIKEWYDEDVKSQMDPHGPFFINDINKKKFYIIPSNQQNEDGLGNGGEDNRTGYWRDVLSGDIVMKKSRSKKKGMEGVSN